MEQGIRELEAAASTLLVSRVIMPFQYGFVLW